MSITRKTGSALAALTILGALSAHSASAQTVIINGAFAAGSPGTNLTTLGTTDWAKWGYNNNYTTFVQKGVSGAGSAPVGYISNITAVSGQTSGGPAFPSLRLSSQSRNVSWTDGSSSSYATTGSSGEYVQNADYANPANSGVGMGFTFDVSVPALSTGTFYLFEDGYQSQDTLKVTSSNGTASSMMSVDNVGNGQGYFSAAINNALPTSDILHFTFYQSAIVNSSGGSTGDYSNPNIQAATLSLTPLAPSAAPEPSQVWGLGLAALGLGGLALKARRRNAQA